MTTMQSFSSTGMYQSHHPSIPSSHKTPTAPIAPTTSLTPTNTDEPRKPKIRNGMTEDQIIEKLGQCSFDEIMDMIAWQVDKNPNHKNFGSQEQEKETRLLLQQKEQQKNMGSTLLETSKKTSSSAAQTTAMPQQQHEYMQSRFRHEDREGAKSEVSLAGTGIGHLGPGYKSFIPNPLMKSPLIDASAPITLRLLITSPSSRTISNAHDIFELSPTLPYIHLIPRIRTFLLNISRAAQHQTQQWDHNYTNSTYNPKPNLPISFTPSSTIRSIKIIWAGVSPLHFPKNQTWDRDFGVSPSSDVVVTKENWGGILKALKKRDGAMDVVLVEVEGVGGYEDVEGEY